MSERATVKEKEKGSARARPRQAWEIRNHVFRPKIAPCGWDVLLQVTQRSKIIHEVERQSRGF